MIRADVSRDQGQTLQEELLSYGTLGKNYLPHLLSPGTLDGSKMPRQVRQCRPVPKCNPENSTATKVEFAPTRYGLTCDLGEIIMQVSPTLL